MAWYSFITDPIQKAASKVGSAVTGAYNQYVAPVVQTAASNVRGNIEAAKTIASDYGSQLKDAYGNLTSGSPTSALGRASDYVASKVSPYLPSKNEILTSVMAPKVSTTVDEAAQLRAQNAARRAAAEQEAQRLQQQAAYAKTQAGDISKEQPQEQPKGFWSNMWDSIKDYGASKVDSVRNELDKQYRDVLDQENEAELAADQERFDRYRAMFGTSPVGEWLGEKIAYVDQFGDEVLGDFLKKKALGYLGAVGGLAGSVAPIVQYGLSPRGTPEEIAASDKYKEEAIGSLMVADKWGRLFWSAPTEEQEKIPELPPKEEVDVDTDTDGDGVPDTLDLFPEDKTKSTTLGTGGGTTGTGGGTTSSQFNAGITTATTNALTTQKQLQVQAASRAVTTATLKKMAENPTYYGFPAGTNVNELRAYFFGSGATPDAAKVSSFNKLYGDLEPGIIDDEGNLKLSNHFDFETDNPEFNSFFMDEIKRYKEQMEDIAYKDPIAGEDLVDIMRGLLDETGVASEKAKRDTAIQNLNALTKVYEQMGVDINNNTDMNLAMRQRQYAYLTEQQRLDANVFMRDIEFYNTIINEKEKFAADNMTLVLKQYDIYAAERARIDGLIQNIYPYLESEKKDTRAVLETIMSNPTLAAHMTEDDIKYIYQTGMYPPTLIRNIADQMIPTAMGELKYQSEKVDASGNLHIYGITANGGYVPIATIPGFGPDLGDLAGEGGSSSMYSTTVTDPDTGQTTTYWYPKPTGAGSMTFNAKGASPETYADLFVQYVKANRGHFTKDEFVNMATEYGVADDTAVATAIMENSAKYKWTKGGGALNLWGTDTAKPTGTFTEFINSLSGGEVVYIVGPNGEGPYAFNMNNPADVQEAQYWVSQGYKVQGK